VSVIGRNTRGVKLIDLEQDEKVVAVSRAPVDSSSGNGETPEESTPETAPTEEK